jgi:hypothetical protein
MRSNPQGGGPTLGTNGGRREAASGGDGTGGGRSLQPWERRERREREREEEERSAPVQVSNQSRQQVWRDWVVPPALSWLVDTRCKKARPPVVPEQTAWLSHVRCPGVTDAYVVSHHRPSTRHPLQSRQYTWHDTFISHATRTGTTQKGQISKKNLAEFISKSWLKKTKIEKKSLIYRHVYNSRYFTHKWLEGGQIKLASCVS